MQYPIKIPKLVLEAVELAESLGFEIRAEGNRAGSENVTPSCCIDETGALLKTLASTVIAGNIGEIGTGAGVGAAWMVSGLSAATSFATVESQDHLAGAVAKLFQDYTNVTVLHDDWQNSFSKLAPFDLLFADGGGVGSSSPEQWQDIADLLKPGGIMIMDDVTPEEFWPESWRGQPDSKRELAFNSGYFCSTEVRVRTDVAVLLMVRI